MLLLDFLALLAKNGFAAKLNFIPIERQNLYQDLVAFFQLISNGLNSVFRNFTDMQQAIGARENFDEGAKLR